MAWALIFDGVDDFAAFTPVNRSDASWRIEFRVANLQTVANTTSKLLGQTASLNDSFGIRWTTTGDAFTYRVDAVNTEITSSPSISSDNDYHDYIIVDNGTDMSLSIDSGSPVVSAGGGGRPFKDFACFCRASSGFFTFAIEYFKYYNTASGDVLIHNWDAAGSDHSAGAQPTLTDLASGNNAVGSGFATDGSAWVELGSGGATVSASQLEQPETNTLSISAPAQIAAAQSDAGEAQQLNLAGVLTAIINADQFEQTETNALSINAPSQIFVAQAGQDETQSLNLAGVLTAILSAAQLEQAETSAVSINAIAQIASAQEDDPELNTLSLTSTLTSTLAANQVGATEQSVVSLASVAGISVDQPEAIEPQVIQLRNVLQLSALQYESESQQAGFIVSDYPEASLTFLQAEAPETNQLGFYNLARFNADQVDGFEVQSILLRVGIRPVFCMPLGKTTAVERIIKYGVVDKSPAYGIIERLHC